MTDPWIAVQVRVKAERQTARLLRDKGYEEFCPMFKSRRPSSKREEELPLFPGYVFCRCDWTISSKIVTTPGVLRILGFGNKPAQVSDEEIESIRLALSSGRPIEPSPYVTHGDFVYVIAGPLRGVCGRVENAECPGKLILSVTLLQRSLAVAVEPEWVSRTERALVLWA
jgi:transcription antitermination factor NusG